MTKAFFVVGEDALCCAMAVAMLGHGGVPVDTSGRRIIAGGAGPFMSRIGSMNQVAANVMPVLMLADADQAPCVVEQRNSWMPAKPNKRFALRLAVREAEAWVLADHVGFSKFVGVSKDVISPRPEEVPDPKQALLSVVRKSKNRELREEMLPQKGARSPVGLGYNVHLVNFVEQHWDIDRAMARAPSLARAMPKVAAMIAAA
ncbi:hypothetical protein C2I33_11035 [Ralstonia solanacearum]|uniref:hypothetical protein n=1 Tax=Ralstonia solanacearum TaxID=305 RepID=UPI00018168C1|nr:hypothetical protein [Ralstonia solanacearum]MDC6179643.1 hypothetical protein [Ralstonia solanacearum]MDC6212281.1 hypothetical protein [Ralstonia solanacearum]MDC6241258.1 hypothetical protein [Ralstonia solanacearum]MDD7802768.1 hypothetical protein [Ralstonia solanacearum]TYZ54913.1 hypothetical protein C2I33_11035 [Ralstonia solanacearum]